MQATMNNLCVTYLIYSYSFIIYNYIINNYIITIIKSIWFSTSFGSIIFCNLEEKRERYSPIIYIINYLLLI